MSSKAYMQRYRQEHREQARAYMRIYHREHQEEARVYNEKYHQEHKRYAKKRRGQIKLEVLSHYSVLDYPICAHCSITDMDVLTIDHINGNGKAHRKLVGTGNNLYYWLINNNFPEGYQILCRNCNWRKRIYVDECVKRKSQNLTKNVGADNGY